MSEYDLDSCGWEQCKKPSTIIFYSKVGLCDKHCEEWLNKKPEFKTAEEASIFLVKTYCKKEVSNGR